LGKGAKLAIDLLAGCVQSVKSFDNDGVVSNYLVAKNPGGNDFNTFGFKTSKNFWAIEEVWKGTTVSLACNEVSLT
jgi:hypothetical protein